MSMRTPAGKPSTLFGAAVESVAGRREPSRRQTLDLAESRALYPGAGSARSCAKAAMSAPAQGQRSGR